MWSRILPTVGATIQTIYISREVWPLSEANREIFDTRLTVNACSHGWESVYRSHDLRRTRIDYYYDERCIQFRVTRARNKMR